MSVLRLFKINFEMMKRLLIIGLSILFTFCKDNREDIENVVLYTKENAVIRIPESSTWRNYIETANAEKELHSFELVTTAIVRTIPTQRAEIASPFSGRILKSFVTLGQKISINTPIFEISSPEYFEAQKDYFNAKQEFLLAKTQFKREQDLLDNGVGVRQEAEQAESIYLMAKTALHNSEEALKTFNVSLHNLSLGTPLLVRSPIRGEVIQSNIVIGQYLAEDAEPIIQIADLDKVWIVARVKEKDLAHLMNQEKVEVLSNDNFGKPIEGVLIHINELVDEESRSVEVFIEVDNENRIWKPGMFTNIRFIDKAIEVMTVSAKAVLQSEESEFVFVKVANDTYQKREIKTAGVLNDKVIIVEGLKEIDEVVIEGGVYLMKAL